MRVAIVTPSNDMVHADYAFCLAQLVAHSSRAGVELALINPRSSLVQKGRWQGVKDALAAGASHILFIDSDQTFPANALLRLLAHKKPFVGAAPVTRREPIRGTALSNTNARHDFKGMTGLHEVKAMGLGFCLVETGVFTDIPADLWFSVQLDGGRWVSEDENLCQRVRLRSNKILVDADLTQEVGHIGTRVYYPEDAGSD